MGEDFFDPTKIASKESESKIVKRMKKKFDATEEGEEERKLKEKEKASVCYYKE